jgi:hypothetical protein
MKYFYRKTRNLYRFYAKKFISTYKKRMGLIERPILDNKPELKVKDYEPHGNPYQGFLNLGCTCI